MIFIGQNLSYMYNNNVSLRKWEDVIKICGFTWLLYTVFIDKNIESYFTWDHKPLQCMDNTEGYKT